MNKVKFALVEKGVIKKISDDVSELNPSESQSVRQVMRGVQIGDVLIGPNDSFELLNKNKRMSLREKLLIAGVAAQSAALVGGAIYFFGGF